MNLQRFISDLNITFLLTSWVSAFYSMYQNILLSALKKSSLLRYLPVDPPPSPSLLWLWALVAHVAGGGKVRPEGPGQILHLVIAGMGAQVLHPAEEVRGCQGPVGQAALLTGRLYRWPRCKKTQESQPGTNLLNSYTLQPILTNSYRTISFVQNYSLPSICSSEVLWSATAGGGGG